METKTAVIIGATSAIAQSVARLLAERGIRFFLVARNEVHMRSVSADLLSRGASGASLFVADLRMRDVHADIVARSIAELGKIDLVFIAHGTLPDQLLLDHDIDATLDCFMTNAVSVISLSHRYASVLEEQGSGSIVCLSSVAGERGRRSNYTYGASKSAITAFYSGLRSRLAPLGVNVLTVKPGPVDTPMTTNVAMPMKAAVGVVSADIVRAIDKRASVVYTPGVWRLIMAVVRAIPEGIFMKIKS
ncbi:MAG: SDR family NAD(P)-dependent oxidoreductase [Candidatus Kapabacteria bacterium]|nr:SDR family NAD(P)-dependent oxidoreductase [Candidatus Kapabacteria bacterium]